MPKTRILLVEDERVVAKDIRNSLKLLGYEVCASVPSGEEAVEKAGELRPDLILMDIFLAGEMSGVDAAEIIQEDLRIPVVYLTSFADEKTFAKAKITDPYGYILKPFEERELYIVIEMALYKHGMERKLKESQEWLATTLRSIGDGVIATDHEESIIFLNPVAEILTGWKQEEAAGQPLEKIFQPFPEPPRRASVNPRFPNLPLPEPLTLPLASILVARDGTPRLIDHTIAPIREDRGNTLGTVIIFRDITERRQMEEQMRHSQEMKVLGQIAAGVAHEVRNPLNAILSINEALFQDIGSNPEYQPYLQHIRTQVARLSRLMKDLLDLGKPSQPPGQEHRESLEQIWAASLNLWQGTAHARTHPIRFLAQAGLEKCRVAADSSRMQQVFLNLLENAAQNSPEGKEIILRLDQGVGDAVRVQVIDQGRGVAPENLDKVFDPFFTTRRGGTGLGLTVVKQLIKSAGGEIRLINHEPSPGCTVELTLPVEKREES